MSSVPEDPQAFVAPSRERLPAASAMAVGPPVRLLALSDGIYAIAMTLLVLDLSLPEGLDSAEFHRELRAMVPQFLAYGLSFTLLVGFWQDQRRIHMLVRQADEGFIRLTALGLGAVALVPFPTSMLSDYTDEPVAVALYSAVIAAIDLIHLAQFTLLCRRPRLRTRAVPRRLLWGFSAELGSTILVFGTAAIIALFDPTVAMYSWLALIPLKIAVGRASRGGRCGPPPGISHPAPAGSAYGRRRGRRGRRGPRGGRRGRGPRRAPGRRRAPAQARRGGRSARAGPRAY